MKKRVIAVLLAFSILSANTLGTFAASAEEAGSVSASEAEMTATDEVSAEEAKESNVDEVSEPETEEAAVDEGIVTEAEGTGDEEVTASEAEGTGDEEVTASETEGTAAEEVEAADPAKDLEENKTEDVSAQEQTDQSSEKKEPAAEESDAIISEGDHAPAEDQTATDEVLEALVEAETFEYAVDAMLSKADAQYVIDRKNASTEENINTLINYIRKNGAEIDDGIWKIQDIYYKDGESYTAYIAVNLIKGFVRFQTNIYRKENNVDIFVSMDYDLNTKQYSYLNVDCLFHDSFETFSCNAEIDPETFTEEQELDFKIYGGIGIKEEQYDAIITIAKHYKNMGFQTWTLVLSKASMYFPWIGFPNYCYHVWNDEYTVDKEATCTEEGSKSIHCIVCDKSKKDSIITISKKRHEYGEWTVTKPATCTEEGCKEKTCQNCGDTVTEVIPAKGHKRSGSYTIDKPATKTENGSKSIHCSVCGEIIESTVRTIYALSGKWVKYSKGWKYRWSDFTYSENSFEIIDGRTYFFNAEGYMVTGWKSINGKWYYFGAGGAMTYGWQYIGRKWYYMNGDGIMQTGLQKIGGKWYYFAGSGAMQTGWKKIGGKWYYFAASGAAKTGWLKSGCRLSTSSFKNRRKEKPQVVTRTRLRLFEKR